MNQQARTRLQTAISHLSLRPVRTARAERACRYCTMPIRAGHEYRDGGPGKQVHVSCYENISASLKQIEKGRGHGNQTDHTSAGTGATDR